MDASNNHFVIAVVGLAGSGKTEVTRYLEAKGLPNVYFGGIVLDEVKRRGLPLIQEHERTVREEIRAQYGMGAMATLSLEKIRGFYQTSHVLIESHYSWEEYLVLREEFGDHFRVIAVWASPQTRYKRLVNRPERPLSATEAWERDKSQLENTHQGGPIAMADYMLMNHGTLEELHHAADEAYQFIVRTRENSFSVGLGKNAKIG